MKTTTWILVNVLGIALGLAAISVVVLSDDDDDHEGSGWHQSRFDVAPATNAFYNDECGSCHFPYQPGLLPARSWQKMMVGLEDHFGENAELDTVDAQQIADYLVANAADTSNYKRSQGIVRSLGKNDAPLRIDRKSTRLNSSHTDISRMPSSA